MTQRIGDYNLHPPRTDTSDWARCANQDCREPIQHPYIFEGDSFCPECLLARIDEMKRKPREGKECTGCGSWVRLDNIVEVPSANGGHRSECLDCALISIRANLKA